MPTTSQYHVLHHFARKLYEAFVRAGMKCRLLEGDDRILSTMRSKPDFTIGFNGALKMEDNSLFCDYVKVPHVACLVDPPYRFLNITKSPYVSITCDDQLCCRMLEEMDFDRTFFMPHAVEKDLAPDRKAKRVYDVALLATCIDFEGRRKKWRKEYPKAIFELMEEAVEVTLSDDDTSFITVLRQKLSPWEYQKIYEEVELYIKGKDRFDLIKAIKGHQVHVFGGSVDNIGWGELLKRQKNVVVHQAIDYEQALDIMKRSKVVLNSSIKNKLGAHERIFSASACGAVVATNDNAFIRKNFKHGKEMLLFKCGGYEVLDGEINELLKDGDRWAEVAFAGRKKVMKHHTWDNRVADLLAWYKVCKN